MAKMMDKFYNLMGLSDVIEETVETVAAPVAPVAQEERETPFTRRATERNMAPIVNLNAERQKKEHKVVIMEPLKYDDAQKVADHLKNRRQVILNLEKAERDMARQMIDFVSGATYALNGSMQKVGTYIFVFAPSNIDISTEIASDESPLRATLSWMSKA